MHTQPTQINLLNHHAAKRLRQLRERLALSRPKFAAMLDIPQPRSRTTSWAIARLAAVCSC